ncbi:MAG: cytochrome P450 [Ilumatobacteraceae bacterium]
MNAGGDTTRTRSPPGSRRCSITRINTVDSPATCRSCRARSRRCCDGPRRWSISAGPSCTTLELRGTRLHEGDKVMVFYGSANRDEDVFTDPDTFDVGRTPNPHLAFGGGGPHLCLGLHVARVETRRCCARC